MERDSKKSPDGKSRLKQRRHETVAGFSRFLYATNLMLETASSQSKHELTRYETLLLSIFRDGTISRKHLDGQFRSLLAVQPENDVATHALDSAFDGLVRKGLIKSVKRSVEFTKKGRTELQRLSDIVDAVYDQLIGTLRGRHRKALQDLMRKIGSP